MVSKTLIFVLVLCFIGIGTAQLITAYQVCQMQQMALKRTAAGDTLDTLDTLDETAIQEINDYCLKHAYDHIGNAGTLG